MKILITGGAGFIGSHLSNFLVNKNFKVYALDNLFSGSYDNIKSLEGNKNFEFKKFDITNKLNLEKSDFIFNLASPASPKFYQHDPLKTVKTNVIGSFNVLEYAHKYNTPILQASTSEVYGDPKIHPQSEDYWGNVNPIGIRACYDEGKRCAETIFFDFNRSYNLPIKIIRIFNTYGPLMQPDDGRVVSNFIMQAINNLPITIYGDGKQTRSFCYIDDLITCLYKYMKLSTEYTGPINVGNPKEQTVKSLALQIIKLTNSKSKIIYKKIPLDDPLNRKPNISKAKKILNWEPKVDINTGLKKTIKYFKSINL
jgi:UDP-glucuronate decarboxylase